MIHYKNPYGPKARRAYKKLIIKGTPAEFVLLHGASASEESLVVRCIRHQVSAGSQLLEDRVDLQAVSRRKELVGEKNGPGGQDQMMPSGVGARRSVRPGPELQRCAFSDGRLGTGMLDSKWLRGLITQTFVFVVLSLTN